MQWMTGGIIGMMRRRRVNKKMWRSRRKIKKKINTDDVELQRSDEKEKNDDMEEN